MPFSLLLASVSSRRGRSKSSAAEALTNEYVLRASRLESTETSVFPTEAALLSATARAAGRPAAQTILFDSRGELLSSEELAEVLRRMRDGGVQRVLLGIGPADGWSHDALSGAGRVVSLGRMTLPHELARAVVAEQIYRALSILAGLPYHLGH